jgi:hypothetical protein
VAPRHNCRINPQLPFSLFQRRRIPLSVQFPLRSPVNHSTILIRSEASLCLRLFLKKREIIKEQEKKDEHLGWRKVTPSRGGLKFLLKLLEIHFLFKKIRSDELYLRQTKILKYDVVMGQDIYVSVPCHCSDWLKESCGCALTLCFVSFINSAEILLRPLRYYNKNKHTNIQIWVVTPCSIVVR